MPIILKKEGICMNKKHFEDINMTSNILSLFHILAIVAMILQIIGCIVGGTIMIVRFSVKYGSLLLFGGVISGAIGLVGIWLWNIVFQCFLDSTCATKELYDISSKKGMLEEATGVFYIIQNVKKNEYASNIVDDGVASSPNIDDAMLFDTKQEAERVVHDFGLSKNDGWFVKQAKI